MRNRAWALSSKRTISELQEEAANRGLSTAGDKTTLLSAILDDITARATATAAATTATAATAATPAVVPVATAAEPVAVAAPATERIGTNNWVLPTGLGIAAGIVVLVALFLWWNGLNDSFGRNNGNGSQPASSSQTSSTPAATATSTSTTTATSTQTATTGIRQETGKGNTLPFPTDASVIGTTIKLSNGVSYQGCSLAKASANGTVTDGVINPNQQELAAATPCVTMQVGNSQTGSANPGNGSGTNATAGLYNLPPQQQIGHPSLYLETGVPCVSVPQGASCTDIDSHTKKYNLQVVDGSTAIIGGFTVDGISSGVYKAVAGPTTLDVTVTDGFVAITQSSWGNPEFCFRVSQAVQYGWAHEHVNLLSGWTCPAPVK